VLEDAHMQRRYLPADWLPANWADSELSPTTIACAANDCHLPVASAINRLLELAERYYASALTGINLLPWRSRYAIIVALCIYRQIGRQLQRNGLQWWRGRTVVSQWRKIILSLASLIHLVPREVPAHDEGLHSALQGLAGVERN